MRVSSASTYRFYHQRMEEANVELVRTLKQLADGKKVRQASDDPTAARSALELRARGARIEGFERSAGLARFDLTTLDSALTESFNLISAARVEAMAGASTVGENGNLERAIVIESLRDQLLALANTVQDGRYLFGGTRTLDPPFDASGVYSGSNTEVQAPIDETQTVGSTLSGERVFLDGGDMFATLADLADALRNGDSAAIAASIAVLGGQLDHLNQIRTDIGNRMQLVDRTVARQTDEVVRIRGRIIQIENVPLERAALELSAAVTTRDALHATAARVLGTSLFDYLG